MKYVPGDGSCLFTSLTIFLGNNENQYAALWQYTGLINGTSLCICTTHTGDAYKTIMVQGEM
jgi:hypothetical protein